MKEFFTTGLPADDETSRYLDQIINSGKRSFTDLDEAFRKRFKMGLIVCSAEKAKKFRKFGCEVYKVPE